MFSDWRSFFRRARTVLARVEREVLALERRAEEQRTIVLFCVYLFECKAEQRM